MLISLDRSLGVYQLELTYTLVVLGLNYLKTLIYGRDLEFDIPINTTIYWCACRITVFLILSSCLCLAVFSARCNVDNSKDESINTTINWCACRITVFLISSSCLAVSSARCNVDNSKDVGESQCSLGFYLSFIFLKPVDR